MLPTVDLAGPCLDPMFSSPLFSPHCGMFMWTRVSVDSCKEDTSSLLPVLKDWFMNEQNARPPPNVMNLVRVSLFLSRPTLLPCLKEPHFRLTQAIDKGKSSIKIERRVVSSPHDPNHSGSAGSKFPKALRYPVSVCFSSFSHARSTKSASDFSNTGSKKPQVLLSVFLFTMLQISLRIS